MTQRVPERLRVAVEVLDPAPDARILEVGCGAGVAVGLICDRLTTGHVTGLDRSATALERAEKRLARCLEEGRADLQYKDLAAFHGDGRPYDAIFAVNVNVFWVQPAAAEVARLVELLVEGGVVRLFYELPDGTDDERVVSGARAALEAGGFSVEAARTDDVVHLAGRLALP